MSAASRLLLIAIGVWSVASTQTPESSVGKGSGSVTIDGSVTSLTHAIRTSRPNPFNDFFNDTVVILSDRVLTTEAAADDAALYARAAKGDLVTVAVRFDGRPKRGQLFNVAINHKGLAETALLPDVWFSYTFKGGAGTLKLESRQFSGRTYAADLEFSVPMPVETWTTDAPKTAGLPPRSKTDADRARATQLLIAALQEGDEARSLEIIKLGIDPNGRDDKHGIPVINWAILMCQPPVVGALVELKADLSTERLPGMSLLSEARAACPDAVGFLKAGGAQ